MLCPCCHNDTHKSFVNISNLPIILFPVDQPFLTRLSFHPLSLSYCDCCDHVFQDHIDPEFIKRIYSDYYQYYPYEKLETFEEAYRNGFDDLFHLFFPTSVREKRLLDIGCSSPALLAPLANRGFYCTGIAPSANNYKSDHIEIIRSQYEECIFSELFDVIILRFTLEHIIDLDIFINKLLRDLKPDGLIFVQVPNTRNYIESKNLCIGAHEHIHYFSPKSISSLFKRFGFHPECVIQWDSPSILACFSMDSKGNTNYLSYSAMSKELEISFKNLVDQYDRISFYGAGMQLIWILYLSNINLNNKLINIIDDNSLIQGKHFAKIISPIVRLNNEVLSHSDVVILSMSPIYYKRAITKVREINSDIPIIILDQSGWMTC